MAIPDYGELNMATFVKTESGKWKAVIRIRRLPTAAKTFRLRNEAMEWARQTEYDMRHGTFVHPARNATLSFIDAMDRYLSEFTPNKRPYTQKAERYRAAKLKEYFSTYFLTGITPELVSKYRDLRLSACKQSFGFNKMANPPKLASGTVRLEISLLSHLFTVAIQEWHLGLVQNPVFLTRRPSNSIGRNRRLSKREERKVLSALANYPNPMLRWAFFIALDTGMRANEIRTLTVGQINLNRRTISLSDTKNKDSRTIPIPKRTLTILKEAIDNPRRMPDCDRLFFSSEVSGSNSFYQFNTAWWKLRKKLDMTDFRFHDLRHEAISRLVEAGLSDLEVASISGHRAMQMLKRYTHLRAGNLVKKLDKVGFGQIKEVQNRTRTGNVPAAYRISA